MEEIHDQRPCYHMNKMLTTNVIDLNKKRKLQAEQLGLPLSKHLCQDRSGSSGLVTIKEIPDKGIVVDEIEHDESAKDSNSFAEESDCAMSEYDGLKLKSDIAISCVDDVPSSSSESADVSGSRTTICPSESITITKAAVGKGELSCITEHKLSCYDDELQELEEHSQDHLIALQNHLDYILDQSKGKELEDILHSNGGNPNAYVLSSGRWKVDQDAEPQSRKPTIDQEFEQYFSTLML